MKKYLEEIPRGYLRALGATLLAWTLAAIPIVPRAVLGLELSDKAVLLIRAGLVSFGLALLALVAWILFFQTCRRLRLAEQDLVEARKRPHRFQDDCTQDEKTGMYRHNTKPGFFCVPCAAENDLETPMVASREKDWGWECPVNTYHFVRGPAWKPYTPVMSANP
jgi:hypothetical protein